MVVILLFFSELALNIVISGVVAMNLWNWFIVPLGVLPLTIWWATGVCLLVRLLVFRVSISDITVLYEQQAPPIETQIAYRLAMRAINAFLLWGIGAIAHHFMTP